MKKGRMNTHLAVAVGYIVVMAVIGIIYFSFLLNVSV
jgi:hypothetical protein